MVIDPLDVDPLLPQKIAFDQTGPMYKANITMHSIKVHGLSGIDLAETTVTRDQNLTDMDMKLVFAFDQLLINGSYAMKVRQHKVLIYNLCYNLNIQP